MLTRRQLLSGSAALFFAQFEAACGSDAAPRSPTNPDDFSRWQALRDALEKSPDHLRAQADAAVASRDPKLIFEFVRDSIATVPPLAQVDSVETAVRFGLGNVLRSGAGTARERAELLASLLGRAGHSASVVSGDVAGPLFENDAPRKVYVRRIDLAFQPGEPEGSGTWLDSAPAGAADPVIVDAQAKDSSALFDRIRPFVADGAQVNPPYLSLSRVPLVQLESVGSPVYLNPLLADAVYGESYVNDLTAAPDMDEPRRVLVRLSATRARAVETPITLAEATFTYHELAGTRLRISPQPLLDLPSLLQAKPLDVNSFATGFALLSGDGIVKRVVNGVALSATGDVVETSKAGVTVSGVPQLSDGDPSEVTAVSAGATATSAPIVELEVAPQGEKGATVAGLPATAFVVEEDGVRVAAVLRENGGAPRVLVLWDPTGSQPTLSAEIAQGIAEAIFEGSPSANVQVASTDGSASLDGFTLNDASAVEQALLALSGVASPTYRSLLQALSVAAPTLIVLFGDGDVEASPALASQCLAAIGKCPVLAVGCEVNALSTKFASLRELADQSGGAFVDGGDLSDLGAVTAAITDTTAARSKSPYRLAYVSRGAAGKHELHITVGTADTTTELTLPKDALANGAWSEFVGMHLHLEMDGEVLEKTLVGLPPAALPDGDDATSVLADASRAARDFLLSSTWISFEGGAPTLSAWFDDALSAAIGWKPVADAISANDAKAAYAATESVPLRVMPRSLLTHPPLPQPPESSGALVVEFSLRAAVHMTLPISQRTSVDLLPTTRFRAIGEDDGKIAFDHALRASLRLAITESAMAKGSTTFYLGSAPLLGFPPGGIEATGLSGFAEAEREPMAALLNRYTTSHRVVAADGSTRAFWAIDSASGTALGILPDATGGAIEECQQLVDITNLLIDQLGILVGLIDSGLANTFVVIGAIGKVAAISYAQAALSFTDPLIDPSIWKLGQTLLCTAFADLISNKIPDAPSSPLDPGSPWAKNLLGGAAGGLVCMPVAPCTPKAP